MSLNTNKIQRLPRLVVLLLCLLIFANQAMSLPMTLNRRGIPPAASIAEADKAAEAAVATFRTLYNDASKAAENSGLIKIPSPQFVHPQPQVQSFDFKPDFKDLKDLPPENSRLVRSYARKSWSV
ncbi:uncharacterized protein UTRI_03638_B [Ustilago trichophora]|uniref:Uncharacterized protein n=1 Tax=Ustilago trichophora TaxID=86804 RepID=A0A5C3DZF7_9BASI|nr:uncharacterized protein UTRI_03638_B [Ustilago trichophora]